MKRETSKFSNRRWTQINADLKRDKKFCKTPFPYNNPFFYLRSSAVETL